MARIIEFRIPDTYHPKSRPIPVTGGKVIEFPDRSNPTIRRIQLLHDCSGG